MDSLVARDVAKTRNSVGVVILLRSIERDSRSNRSKQNNASAGLVHGH